MTRLQERRAAKSTAAAPLVGTDLFLFYMGHDTVRCERNRYFDRCFHYFMRVILFYYFWIRPTS
jgi:hypothetical protein